MRKLFNGISASVFALALVPGFVKAAVLDFSGNICGSGVACTNYAPIMQSYGDIPGQVDVSYRSLLGPGNSKQYEGFLKFWDTQYSDLQNVAWGGANDIQYVSEIRFTPLSGSSVTLSSFDLGSWPRQSRNSTWTLFDHNYNVLASSGGNFIVSGGIHSSFAPNITSTNALILQWGPSSYNVGIDNIVYRIQAVQAVPEPSTYALFGVGLGFLTLTMRRRRSALR